MNLKECIKQFIWTLKVDKRLSLNTCKSYEYDLRVFAQWIKKNPHMLDSSDVLLCFFEYLKNEKQNLNHCIYRKLNLLKAFFKFCNENHNTNFVIMTCEQKKLEKIYRSFLEDADLVKIKNYLTSNKYDKKLVRLRCIIEILYSTGLRVSEMLSLKKSDLNEIRKNKSLQIIGKGGKKRVVFFNDDALNALEIYILYASKSSDLLFSITRQRVFQLLKDLGVKLNIPLEKIFPHSFRHRLLTDLVKKGMNLIGVQRIAGHKQITTTERYTHVEDYLYEEIYQFHPLVKKIMSLG